MPDQVRDQDYFVNATTGVFRDAQASTAQNLRDLIVSTFKSQRGMIDGWITANNGTDADHDINFGEGICSVTDGSGDYQIAVNSSTLVKQIDATWAVGTNAGGLDTGTVANSTWYHLWAIMRSDTGVVDALFSTSATAPTMPTNYDYKRRIGAVLTDGTANIRAYAQNLDTFLWENPIDDFDDSSVSTTFLSKTLSVPLGVRTMPIMAALITHASSLVTLRMDSGGRTLSASNQFTFGSTQATGTFFHAVMQGSLTTNTSSQLRFASSSSSTRIVGRTKGWIDPRGRKVA